MKDIRGLACATMWIGIALACATPLYAQTPEQIDERNIRDLVTASHILANEGVLDSFGHASIRSVEEPQPLFHPARHGARAGDARRHRRDRHHLRAGDAKGRQTERGALHSLRGVQGAAGRAGRDPYPRPRGAPVPARGRTAAAVAGAVGIPAARDAGFRRARRNPEGEGHAGTQPDAGAGPGKE